ncbi:glutathione peroxidase [Fusibacter bizertensis]|uniref:Glutathione peroxidase n=1 Tax=Fusibacter bizertensis TaxID=1488331 RepID=A0ABT6NBL7_9FIRM|nr:glutathione peroxidase [Fusibacter bizertensis]MDH8677786.1 glutathione peroxidase [Fusibacter bizertensis]
MKFYDFTAMAMNGDDINMSKYEGEVVLVVNTATKCGLAPQFEELEELHNKYGDKGLNILGFPCNQFANQESGSNDQIQNSCRLDFGVTFQLFEKIDVNGDSAHPLYQFLKKEAKGTLGNNIKWNFTKFLVDKEGNVIKRYAPTVKPLSIEKDIIKLMEA